VGKKGKILKPFPLFLLVRKRGILKGNAKEGGKSMGIGTTELLLILAIVLVLFGAGRIPEVGKALGKGIRNFRSALKGEDEVEVESKKKEEISSREESLPPSRKGTPLSS